MKKNERLGWKVVWKRVGEYQSLTEWAPVAYRLNHWTHRPKVNGRLCGPLAVCNTRREAKDLVADPQEDKIFRCRYVPSTITELWALWKTGDDVLAYKTSLSALPEGTKFAERVMILAPRKRRRTST